MPGQNATVGVYQSPSEACAAIRRLQKSGFDMKQLSVAAREHREEEQVSAYYLSSGHMRCWGEQGALWGAVWALLCGWALFAFPDSGPVLVAGPLSDWIIAGLENASILSGFTGIGAGLYSIGIDRLSISKYEAALKAGKCLVLAHGTADEVAKARAMLHA